MRVVVGLPQDENGRIFLQKRGGGRHQGLWEFPGGKVEEGESDAEALAREWKEELGVDVEVNPNVIATAEVEISGVDCVFPLYSLRLVKGEPTPLVLQAETGWISWEDSWKLNQTPANEWFREYLQVPPEDPHCFFKREDLERCFEDSSKITYPRRR